MAGKRKHIRRVSSEIRLLESELRETESSVSAELQSDEAEALQRAKLQERATQAFRQHEEAKACLGEMNKRIPSLVRRKDLSDDQQTQLSKIVQGASVAANRLLRIDDAKSQILKQLEDAHALCDSLKDLGSYRDHTVLHALNGLANTKTKHASGVPLEPEVFDQLRAVAHETMDLSVSHNNTRVRLHHCLRVVSTMLLDLDTVKIDVIEQQLAELEEQLA
eukprot:m.100833 g.100833  ORF g.100833 m.100833 type:complete len:221 (-) comp13184_c0_seq6:319-981(-)